MISVYEKFETLWPVAVRAKLQPLLSKVPVLCLPQEKGLMKNVVSKRVIVVVDNLPVRDLVTLAQMGFEHIVQSGRKDFAQELLASTLMIIKPESLFANPLPFFLSHFESEKVANDPDRYLNMRFSKRGDKEMLLDWLGVFLAREPRTQSIRDICVQCADEMITNALFNAPILQSGKRAYKDMPRDSEIALPESMAPKLFACFADQRVIVGCTDRYGSLDKKNLLTHLGKIFMPQTEINYSAAGGAGLGVRLLIENSANFYILVNPGKSTMMACGFLLQGLKANLTAAKHLHFNFIEAT